MHAAVSGVHYVWHLALYSSAVLSRNTTSFNYCAKEDMFYDLVFVCLLHDNLHFFRTDLYQVPKTQVQVQVAITPDQVQLKYWSTDSGP